MTNMASSAFLLRKLAGKLILVLLLLPLFLNNPNLALAQENQPTATQASQLEENSQLSEYQPVEEETLEATVTKIIEEKKIDFGGDFQNQPYQELEMEVTAGSLKGESIRVINGDIPSAFTQVYKVGDKLTILYTKDFQGEDYFIITDYIRRDGLILLFVVFTGAALLIGKWHGLTSLLGMALSFLVILKFTLPQISAGNDPITIAIISSLVIAPITFYLSHGFNKKTTVAIVGTIISLVITGLLASFFVEITKLTGFSSEEAGFLQTFHQGTINIKGLLLAGIIIGGLGILDDITISQSAIVVELKETSKKLTQVELYQKAMKIGHDHIASLINTLVLVYTGAALPLLLLFVDSSRSFMEIINYELIAEEIVRTLVASTGLILAVPITTIIASLVFSKEKPTSLT